MTTIDHCTLIELPKFSDTRGSLCPVEAGRHIPFEIKRVFYFFDIPAGENRGAHAHKTLHQFLICLSGSFDLLLDDGSRTKIVHLNRPWRGLYISPMVWAAQSNFDPGTVGIVLASDYFDESDYYRNYEEFLRAKRARTNDCSIS